MSDNRTIFTHDKEIGAELNNKLIKILSTCFSSQSIFTRQRYYKELPSFRWYCQEGDLIIAHVALHEKTITTKQVNILIGGISEVCVHPLHRGKKLAKKLLEEANLFSISRKHRFSMLFGDTNVYKSSGYNEISNEMKYLDAETNEIIVEKAKDAMVKKLSDLEWPEGLIDINGPTF